MNSTDESLSMKNEFAFEKFQSSQTALDYETFECARYRYNNYLKFYNKN